MRYILFDLYGLFHHVQTPQQFAEIAELIGTDADSLRPLYLGRLRHDYDAGLIDAEEYWRLIGAGLGIEIDWRVALAADNDSWEGVHEDMVDFARELHAVRVPIALLSNEPKELTALTRARREWIALFDPVVFSGEVGLAKPDPAIFDLALERMRLVVGEDLQPGEVLFTDDSLVNIEAARELGFVTHLFEGIDGLRGIVTELFGSAATPDGEARTELVENSSETSDARTSDVVVVDELDGASEVSAHGVSAELIDRAPDGSEYGVLER